MPDKPTVPTSAAVLREIEREMTDLTADLLARSKPLVPRDKSTLVRSGTREVRRVGNRIEGRVTYNTPYAARQHEETTWRHPRGGQAKYLEQPLRQMVPEFESRLAAAMRRALS